MNVAGAHQAAVGAALVALLAVLDQAVAAAGERDEALAVGRARAGLTAVDAVVAHLAEGGVDLLVAAVGAGLAVVVAGVHAVGGR